MEAKYDNWYDTLFDVLSNLYEDTSGRTRLSVKCAPVEDFTPDPYIQNLLDNKLVRNLNFINKKDFSIVSVETIEPRYTYYSYHFMGKINSDIQVSRLGELIDSAIIEPDNRYLCSIAVDNERYVYLNWDTGRLRIYDLGNKKTSEKRLIICELIEIGKLVSFQDLRNTLPLKKSYKSYKDVFTTSFLHKTLKSHFLMTTGKSNIGIRKSVYIDGVELIQIIREQLSRIEKADGRHFSNKVSKMSELLARAKNRQD